MKSSSVLLLSEDTVIAALLLSLLELEGFSLLHPEPKEEAAVAVARLKPRFALIDVHHPAATSDALYEVVAAAGTKAVLFSPERSHDGLQVIARQRGLHWFALPIARARLRTLLAEVLGD